MIENHRKAHDRGINKDERSELLEERKRLSPTRPTHEDTQNCVIYSGEPAKSFNYVGKHSDSYLNPSVTSDRMSVD